MSRAIEGTTRLGHVCDASGCSQRATHTPMLCVPHYGYPIAERGPIFTFIDTHVCMAHRASVKGEDITSKVMVETFEEVAAMEHSKPDWSRAYIEWWPVISDEYQKFQEAAGLVEPGDATVKGSIIAPPEFKH